MARRVRQPVQVHLQRRRGGGTEPALFVWRGRRYRVHSVEAIWKEIGRWWDGEGERTIFRVTAAPEAAGDHPGGPSPAAGVYELCCRQPAADWTLVEILD